MAILVRKCTTGWNQKEFNWPILGQMAILPENIWFHGPKMKPNEEKKEGNHAPQREIDQRALNQGAESYWTPHPDSKRPHCGRNRPRASPCATFLYSVWFHGHWQGPKVHAPKQHTRFIKLSCDLRGQIKRNCFSGSFCLRCSLGNLCYNLGSKRVFWHETRTKHAAAGTAQGAKLHSPKQNTRFINFRRDSGRLSERGLFGASFRLRCS
jgi:hypothetical protein